MELANDHISFTKSFADVKKPTLYPFQNRRTSRYLKGVFPSGFNTTRIRNDSVQTDGQSHFTSNDIVRLSKTVSSMSQSPQIDHEYKSFTSWTKGESSVASNNIPSQYEGDLYLDVAGPFFRDSSSINYPDRYDLEQPVTYEADMPPPLSIRHAISLDRKGKVNRNPTTNSSPGIVYLPTAVLPVIIPQHPMLRSGSRSSPTKPFKGKTQVPLEEMVAPHLLPQFLVLQLLRYRDIQSTIRVSEELMMGTRIKVPSNCSFVLLKMQIRHMFETEEGSAGALEINFFNNALGVWRPLKSKEDWETAKLVALERQEQLKVLFAFGKQAELVEGLMPTMANMPRAVSSNVSRSGDYSIGGRLSRASSEQTSLRFQPMKSQPISYYLPTVKSSVAISPANITPEKEPSLDKQLKFAQVLEQRLMMSRGVS